MSAAPQTMFTYIRVQHPSRIDIYACNTTKMFFSYFTKGTYMSATPQGEGSKKSFQGCCIHICVNSENSLDSDICEFWCGCCTLKCFQRITCLHSYLCKIWTNVAPWNLDLYEGPPLYYPRTVLGKLQME